MPKYKVTKPAFADGARVKPGDVIEGDYESASWCEVVDAEEPVTAKPKRAPKKKPAVADGGGAGVIDKSSDSISDLEVI